VVQITGLTPERRDLIDQAAAILHAAFLRRSDDWQEIDSARAEVVESLADERISRVAVAPGGDVVGWIGAIPTYAGRVWEIHPLVVDASHRRRGIGRALVEDLERIVAARGALTLWLGSDDENDETTASGMDLYGDVPGAIRNLKKIGGGHPYPFYVRLGFHVTGLLPDANGRGKPDIFFAKRVAR
jgi:aminoglycoside 6'-N-acetyltransferase I